MKTIKSIILTSAITALLVSCDMDKYPYDKIPVENAVESLADCQKLRSGMYRDLRIITSSTNILAPEFQSDGFIPLSFYGNHFGSQYRWDATAADGSFKTVWGNSYITIAQCNLLIEGIEKLKAKGELSDTDIQEMDKIQGESYFVRSIAYYYLADKFCNAFDASKADNDYGVPLVLKYEPSSDNKKYPARASLAATYQQIKDDITMAKGLLTTAGVQSSEYLTIDALTAFEARIALMTKDYDTAINSAEALINSNKYPLITDANAYYKMWKQDITTEVICQLYSTKQELAPAMGSYFLDEINYKPTFIPSLDILMSYGDNDIRFDAYFRVDGLVFPEGTARMYVCSKYPGNTDMYEGSNNFVNKPKIFRVAEQYLIAAEAYASKGGGENERKAYDVLFKLMSARDNTLESSPVTGKTLITLIRAERERELYAEGFRLSDLKRYGEGMKRQASQADDLSYQLALKLEIAANNTRWLWAIPKDELDANPQIKNQQNPGY